MLQLPGVPTSNERQKRPISPRIRAASRNRILPNPILASRRLRAREALRHRLLHPLLPQAVLLRPIQPNRPNRPNRTEP